MADQVITYRDGPLQKSQTAVDLVLIPGVSMLTAIGGIAVWLKNSTVSTLSKGRVVKADASNDDSVVLAATNDPDPIGIVYADILAGEWGWVVVAGIVDGYVDNAGATAREAWVGVSASNAGQMTSGSIPTGTTEHFRECGHTIRGRSGAGLVRMVIHFN